MRRPTSAEPVNDTKRTPGCVTSASPSSPPGPGRKLTTPSGTPASVTSAMRRAAITAVSEDGLSTIVFPLTTAAMAMPARMASGKFHGAITAPTPSGMYE